MLCLIQYNNYNSLRLSFGDLKNVKLSIVFLATSISSASYLLYAQGMYIMEVPFRPSANSPGKQTLHIPGGF